MTEHALWRTLKEHAGPYGKFERIENRVGEGTSDVAFGVKLPDGSAGSGWIELKHLSEWPRRASTKVVLRDFTREQILNMEDWVRHGVDAWLLLQAERLYLLLTTPVARLLHDRQLTVDDARTAARVVGGPEFPRADFLRAIATTRSF